MEIIKNWILGICGAALLGALADAVVPKSSVKNVVSFVCSIVMIFAVVSPIVKIDFSAYSGYIVAQKKSAGEYSKKIEETNARLTKAIIEEDAAAYILDKAHELGIDNAEFKINARLDEESQWYLYSAEITGEIESDKENELGSLIEANLGIPKERQAWS